MSYSREIFYDNYTKTFGKIKNQKTVLTINAILSRAEKEFVFLPQLAYMMATALHEALEKGSTADFYPIMERGGYKYITDQYWHNKRVRGWLGNRSIEEAWNLRGRGLAQITGYLNYFYFGIVNNPDKALELDKAVEILFVGSLRGKFTGKKLSDFINTKGVNYEDARTVINGRDKAKHIAGIAIKIESILRKSI